MVNTNPLCNKSLCGYRLYHHANNVASVTRGGQLVQLPVQMQPPPPHPLPSLPLEVSCVPFHWASSHYATLAINMNYSMVIRNRRSFILIYSNSVFYTLKKGDSVTLCLYDAVSPSTKKGFPDRCVYLNTM